MDCIVLICSGCLYLVFLSIDCPSWSHLTCKSIDTQSSVSYRLGQEKEFGFTHLSPVHLWRSKSLGPPQEVNEVGILGRCAGHHWNGERPVLSTACRGFGGGSGQCCWWWRGPARQDQAESEAEQAYAVQEPFSLSFRHCSQTSVQRWALSVLYPILTSRPLCSAIGLSIRQLLSCHPDVGGL
jgi:hypothetical protein